MNCFNTMLSSLMYPENLGGTRVILGSMNMGYDIYDTIKPRTRNLFRPKRVPILVRFGVTVTHLQNVIHTQKCKPCQVNNPTTPFPARGFPPDTASSTRPKAQAWPQLLYFQFKTAYAEHTITGGPCAVELIRLLL